MIFARAICADSRADLALAAARMGLPSAAFEELAHLQLLLTGLGEPELRFLRASIEPAYTQGALCRPDTGLLSGLRPQFLRLIQRTPEGLAALAVAIEKALAALAPPPPLTLGARRFTFGQRTHLMGVINVTPDSFSDGGQFFTSERAVEHGLALARAGADVLDVGGESTRPGSLGVGADEELSRVVPVIAALRQRTDVPISIDTTKAAVAAEALKAGAVLVNDVSGLRFDDRLADVIASFGAACCLMHSRATPRTMQDDPAYADVVEEVVDSLSRSVARAEGAGVARGRLLVDPGIGFGKTVDHNLFLLRRAADLRVLGLPVVIGTSRKSFLGQLTRGTAPPLRALATAGSVAALAMIRGADIVRVHDVEQMRDALAVADAIADAAGGGELYRRGECQ